MIEKSLTQRWWAENGCKVLLLFQYQSMSVLVFRFSALSSLVASFACGGEMVVTGASICRLRSFFRRSYGQHVPANTAYFLPP